MATNKRKDAAALFELIDKSTLKIPKHTGSLKIPAWWSSKANPPAGAASSGSGVPGDAGSFVPSRKQEGGASGVVENRSSPPGAPQRRLFEPSANHHGVESPSIRPPAPASAFRMARASPASPELATQSPPTLAEPDQPAAPRASAPVSDASPSASPDPEGGADRVSGEPAEGYAGSGNGRRVFAPQTMSQGENLRSEWASPRFHLARAPLWLLVAGGAVAAVIVVLIFYGLVHAFSGSSGTPARPQTNAMLPHTPSIPSAQHPLLPRPDVADHGQRAVTPAPPPAQVYAPGTVTRLPHLYYIQISSVREPRIAQENAKLLADHGVNVSIETQMGKNILWYKIFSVDGFASLSESEALRSHIVAIGRLHKDFARTRKGAFDDAFAARWSAIIGVKE